MVEVVQERIAMKELELLNFVVTDITELDTKQLNANQEIEMDIRYQIMTEYGLLEYHCELK